MSSNVIGFREIGKTKTAMVGGKGANLGELARIEGISVPDGFCISTETFKRIVGEKRLVNELIDQLSLLKVDDRNKVGELSREIRKAIEGISIPEDINEEVSRFLSRLGETNAYAVRSSATAEDLPTASFAGQQDTYLNIIGKEAIFKNISKCWASLFTDRAVIYRIQNGFDHRKVSLSVIVQQMVFPVAAGILFTADPLTSNRRVLSIDASFGLGEAMVSGLVNADSYKVCDGKITGKTISAKKLAIHALPDGGTKEEEIEPEKQNVQALTDEQVLQLARLGRKIEEHFGGPQDIEWCLAGDTFHILQNRPITTLYPIPAPPSQTLWQQAEVQDEGNHVFVSVGHQQMMTDPFKPLGISLWQLTAGRAMYHAGGRLFVDVTEGLSSPGGRDNLLNVLGQSDPLIKDALTTIIERDNFIKLLPGDHKEPDHIRSHKGMSSADIMAQAGDDPAIVCHLIKAREKDLAALKQNILTKSGAELFDFILQDLQQLRQGTLYAKHLGVIMAAMNAAFWINDKMKEWLGEKNAADVLSQSVPNNITSEMGLQLLDVADVIRPFPEVINYLERVNDNDFLDELVKVDGGQQAWDAIYAFLQKYGMRCAGEIDITRTRWSEKPGILIPTILAHIKNFEHGEGERKFEQGLQEALKREQELLEDLKQLPGGEQKATETKQMIDLIRNFAGYREYPKYNMVSRYFVYKQALLREARTLVKAGVIPEKEDIYYLTFPELREVVCTLQLDKHIITKRKDEFDFYKKLAPPRVITSDGEIISGKYKRENIPAEAIVGLPVSSGIIEGRARVILNMEDADLEDGDILVTPFTDPSWTPLFVSIKGLVTEVGGLMTHGAVIAREYGLPAVVGVEHATRLIKDGQRIRVNGIDGYVEIIGAAILNSETN